jgi:hypothetical protein
VANVFRHKMQSKILRKFQNLGFVRLNLAGDILKRLSLFGVVKDNAVSRN